jgi:hypothetical protein
MAAKKTTQDKAAPAAGRTGKVNLGALLSTTATYVDFEVCLVGNTPLIVHAWSEKSRREMLQKQTKATKSGKEARNPQEDFLNSLYEMGVDRGKKFYGFPVTGIKNAILSSAHKDKGVPRAVVQRALWLDADMVRVRPALSGAICDMPLVRIYGSDPEMREDMVRIGAGLNKTANLAYRGQFSTWAVMLTGRFNETALSTDALQFLINEAGLGTGIGEWRNEKKGIFGAFRLANIAEQNAWKKYIAGNGPLPVARQTYAEAAE